MTNADYVDDLTNAQAVGGIGFYLNANKTEHEF